jgi:hypothetical protein
MSLLPANLLVMLLLWNNIRFQNEPPNPNQLTKEPVPRDLIEDGISNGKSASVYQCSRRDVAEGATSFARGLCLGTNTTNHRRASIPCLSEVRKEP